MVILCCLQISLPKTVQKKVMGSQSWKSRKAISPFGQAGSQIMSLQKRAITLFDLQVIYTLHGLIKY